MNRLLLIFNILFFSLASLAQEDNLPIDTLHFDYKNWMQNYIANPALTDSMCISDINRAKTDVANGKIVFTQEYGFLYGEIRYESELRELCKDYGLLFDFDVLSDVIFKGQTQGCYGAYMDKLIANKFGCEFKDKLHKTADSIFLSNVVKSCKAIQYWDCDERPRLPNEKKRTDDYLPAIIVSTIDIRENKEQSGGWPFFDLGFTVELDSTISEFYIRNFVPELRINKMYKSDLFKIAVKYMNDNYPIWIPGKVNGQMVRTNNNVILHFRKE